jgi:hypothetical protein
MKCCLFIAIFCLSSLWNVAYSQRFTAVNTYSVGSPASNPRGIVTGDIDRDGYPDIVTANYPAAEVGILLNRRNGTLAPVVGYALGLGNNPYDLAMGDFNQDGYPDLATANYLGRTVSVLLNKQDGTFAIPAVYTVAGATYPESIVAADVNNDGYPDLVTANLGNTTISVFLNQRDGTFSLSNSYPIAANSLNLSLAVADLNHDGYLDIVTACYASSSNLTGVFLNQQDGSFAAVMRYELGADSQPFGVAVGDLNGDGYADVLTANLGNNTVSTLLNQGDGTLGSSTAYATGSNSQPYGVALGDIDGDGQMDIVTSNIGTSTVGLLLNQKAGQFTPVATYSTGLQSEPGRLVVADVDKNGKLDILTANSATGTVGVLLGQSVLAAQGAATTASTPNPTIYPNPAISGTALLLSTTGFPPEAHSLEVTLFDVTGRLVEHLTLVIQGATPSKLAITQLATGLYIARLTVRDNRYQALGTLPAQRIRIE